MNIYYYIVDGFIKIVQNRGGEQQQVEHRVFLLRKLYAYDCDPPRCQSYLLNNRMPLIGDTRLCASLQANEH